MSSAVACRGKTSVLVLHCLLTWRLLVPVVPPSLFFQMVQTSLRPILPEQERRVATSCGDFVTWRNSRGDEITLVLFPDPKECKAGDLIHMQTWADALICATW